MLPCQAHAQPTSCDSGSPGSDACTQLAPAPVPVVKKPRRDAERDFFLPNGTLTPPGKVAISIHEFGLLNTFSFGVNERLEITASGPLIPFVVSVGARVSLTPRKSRFKTIVGVSFWSPLLGNDDDGLMVLTHFSGTAAYHADSFEVHATLSGAYHDDEGWMLPAANIGMSMRLNPRFRLHANYASINVDNIDWSDGDNPRLNGLLLGLKYSGARWDADFGFILPTNLPDDDSRFAVPMLSFHHTF